MLRYEIKYELFEMSINGVISQAQVFIASALLDSLTDEQVSNLAPTYADTLLALIELKPVDALKWLTEE